MDHINITQECVHCLMGKKVFRVDLNLYDADTKKQKKHWINYIVYLIKQYSHLFFRKKVLSLVKKTV